MNIQDVSHLNQDVIKVYLLLFNSMKLEIPIVGSVGGWPLALHQDQC